MKVHQLIAELMLQPRDANVVVLDAVNHDFQKMLVRYVEFLPEEEIVTDNGYEITPVVLLSF